ncbi:MAG: endonuclease/exonuclease/phosphatase family protein [Xanthomonadales bacterium]|nr:endonuclease/exonuclease/phosphatase family protein [Xanthomonadales bacterium]
MARPRHAPQRTLRLLSANIQAGARTDGFGQYVTRSVSHLLPSSSKQVNLDNVAGHLEGFDLVGLQEADPGSLRSGFINQTHYLAELAQFPFWSHQPNRRVGPIATSANALLARVEPAEVRDYPLPGPVRGRGVLWARFNGSLEGLTVMIAHLSLGRGARLSQLAFLGELAQDARHAVLMGDFNCEADAPEMRAFFDRSVFKPPAERLATFPSWQPRRAIDHILVTEHVEVARRWSLPELASDHLATAAEIHLPHD